LHLYSDSFRSTLHQMAQSLWQGLINMSRMSGTWLFRICVSAAAALNACILSSAHAYAVSDRVKEACRDDYFRHCSEYAVGSASLRQCMRNVGEGLSTPCLVALVQEGEITKADIDRHNSARTEGGKGSNSQNVPRTREATSATKERDGTKVTVAKRSDVDKAGMGGKVASGSKAVKVSSADKAANSGKVAKGRSDVKADSNGNMRKATKVANVSKAMNADKATNGGDAAKADKGAGNTSKAATVASAKGTAKGGLPSRPTRAD
jgi:hypothetical protein